MIEKPWDGITIAPDRLYNNTPAWMCLTREGDDAKVRRDKKNARMARRRRRPRQLMFAF